MTRPARHAARAAFGTLPDGRAYLVMEWLQGETLGARMERERLPLAEAIGILGQVCRAPASAHAKAIVHRDLKPENVFLVDVPGEGTIARLLDFGLAKLLGTEDQIGRTKSGATLGTPLCMSPEQ